MLFGFSVQRFHLISFYSDLKLKQLFSQTTVFIKNMKTLILQIYKCFYYNQNLYL